MAKIRIRFNAIIKFVNGIKKPVVQNTAYYQKHIDSFEEGGSVVITIEDPKKIRTTGKPGETSNQNGYYWHVVLPVISKHTGDAENDLHEYFKRKFLPPRFMMVMGETMKFPGTTTLLSRNEFTEYWMRIEAFVGAEYGIQLPNQKDAGYEV